MNKAKLMNGMFALIGIILAVIIASAWSYSPSPAPVYDPLGKTPTRLLKGHIYMFQVHPWWFKCETEIAIACAEGATPCRVWLAGKQYYIAAGTIFTKSLNFQNVNVNNSDFNGAVFTLKDQTTYPSTCCTSYPWSGGTGTPCRVMAWYNLCCVDTRVGCIEPLGGF